MAITCGTYAVQVVGRGGSPLRVEATFESLSYSYVLNQTSQARVSISAAGEPNSLCCEVFNESEPWRDEVLIYRDGVPVWVGPLITVTSSGQGGELAASDLSHWMEQRFLLDVHANGDAGDVFRAVFEAGYEQDTSPNIELTTRSSGVRTTVDFKASEFHRCADALRDLATYGVDWTTMGRDLLAGGKEVFSDTTALLLHDDGVLTAEVTKEGASLATDVAVFGSTGRQGAVPINGRAESRSDVYGLIQRSYTQLLIQDNAAADDAAEARLESMQPSPLRLRVTLSSETAFDFDDLVPGRRMDVRLAEKAGCVEIAQEMRLLQVDVSAGAGKEEVSLQLVPTGIQED